MAYINQPVTIRKFIEGMDTLYPYIFNRIYVGSLPAENQGQPCISAVILGGESNPSSEVQVIEMELRFWGGSIIKGLQDGLDTSRVIYQLFQDAVYDNNYMVTLDTGEGRVVSMDELVPGVDRVDLDTEWRFVLAIWRMVVNSRV